MVLSIIAMSGLTVAPASAAAQAGDLIKMDGLSSVYYLGNDGKRYVFPSESVYFSWYNDFSGVVTIPASELQSYPLGANVTMRPGTKLVKITTDPSVYAVTPNGVLRKIQSEADAIALYGSNWNKIIVDVADSFFTNYTVGTPLTSGQYPAGTLLKNANNASVYYYDGTNYRLIANEAAFTANRFNFANIVTTTATLTAGGTSITGFETFSAPSGGVGPIITGSGLTLSLSAATPASTSIPASAVRVPFTKVNLTAANDGAISLNSLTVKRIGLSSATNVKEVWAEKDGVLVTSKKSMSSNDESILVFSPALVIPAGQTVSIDLAARLDSATGNMGLAIVSASAVSSSAASVTGSFPINGNLMALTTYDLTQLSLVSTSSASYNVKVGDEKVELGKMEIGFKAYAKDVTLKSITLKNNGSEDLSRASMNLFLENNGNKVSDRYTVDGRFVTFYFPGTGLDLLKDDSSKIFYIKGDMIAKENTGNSFVFVLNKATDLVAVEKNTGFGVNTYAGTTLADNAAISTVVLASGKVSVSKKSASPAATTIVKGSDNTVLIANVRADEQINVDGINVRYGSATDNSATVDNFENIRVYVNGMLLDSFDPAATSSSAMQTEAIDSNFTLNKGDNEIKVMVRAKTTAVAASAFYAQLNGNLFDGMNPEYVASGNMVSTDDATGDISGTATGGIFTVQGAKLTTVRSDGYSNNRTIVQGMTDVSLGKFTLKAENDEVKVTSISLAGNTSASSTDVNANSVSDMKLFVDGVQVGSTVDFGSTGSTFSSLNFTIAKDSTKIVEVKGSFDASAAGGFLTVMTVSAQDSRGSALTTAGGSDLSDSTADFAVVESGSLNVEKAGDTPVSSILVTSPAEKEVARFKFTAVNDSANLTEMTVSNWDGSAATSSADARIAAFKLYDGSNLISEFVPVSGTGKFTINNNVVINANTSKTLSVRAALNNIENDADATDKDLTVHVSQVKFKSTAGSESTQSADVSANPFRIRKTAPTVALQTLPSTILTAGDVVVSRFTVTADSNGDVAFKKVVLKVATSSGVTIQTLASNGLKVDGVTKAVASTVGAGTITVDLDTAPEIIPAGTSKTFEVLTTITATGDNSQSLTTKIDSDANFGTDGNFVWSDGASLTEYTYASGKYVVGLPTNTQALTK